MTPTTYLLRGPTRSGCCFMGCFLAEKVNSISRILYNITSAVCGCIIWGIQSCTVQPRWCKLSAIPYCVSEQTGWRYYQPQAGPRATYIFSNETAIKVKQQMWGGVNNLLYGPFLCEGWESQKTTFLLAFSCDTATSVLTRQTSAARVLKK